MTPVPTPQPAHDHGAAGFCGNHAQPPVERTKTVARVLHEHRLNFGPDDNGECCQAGDWTEGNGDVALEDHQAAAVVAALDDESARLWASADAWWTKYDRELTAHEATKAEVEQVIRAGQAVARGATARIETLTSERDAARAALDRVRALADLMAHGPDRSGEPPLVTQAWTHAADAIRAALGPRDRRTFAHCGFAESHEPHADRDTYCDGSTAAMAVHVHTVARLQAGINDAIPYLGERELAEPILRAALDPEEPR